MVSIEFSAWLKQRVEESGLSERAAAMYAGLGSTTIHLLLAHPDRTPDTDTCLKLAEWAKVDPDYLLFLAGHRPQRLPPPIPATLHHTILRINRMPPQIQSKVIAMMNAIVENLLNVEEIRVADRVLYNGVGEAEPEELPKAA